MNGARAPKGAVVRGRIIGATDGRAAVVLPGGRALSADGWTFADLEPDQLSLVNEAERTLDTDVVMAYAPSPWGTVDPETVADGMHPVELESSQLECLQGLERMVGGVLVAYRRDVD